MTETITDDALREIGGYKIRSRTGRPSESYVYAIQMGNDGPIKIGVATHPPTRLEELQTGNPVRLRVLTTFSGGYELEHELHRKLAEHRMHGEWFQPRQEVLEALREELLRPGRTSFAWPANSTGSAYDRCINCDTRLSGHATLGETPGLCAACEEFEAIRASGEDPFAEVAA